VAPHFLLSGDAKVGRFNQVTRALETLFEAHHSLQLARGAMLGHLLMQQACLGRPLGDLAISLTGILAQAECAEIMGRSASWGRLARR